MGLDLHPARRADDPLYGDEDYPYWPNGPHPQWSYGGFHAFRKRLAEAEAFDLEQMAGFAKAGRSWDDVTTELAPLLSHSDCDGEMTPDECAAVLPRLHGIITEWALTDPCGYDVRAGRELCAAMELCASEGVPLLFR